MSVLLYVMLVLCFVALTFPSLAHGSSVSATLALVIHTKCPHLPVLGQDTCVGLSHGNLSY